MAHERNGRPVGHAITAYLYPPGANTPWTYDYEGSWRASAAERLRSRYNPITTAEFL